MFGGNPMVGGANPKTGATGGISDGSKGSEGKLAMFLVSSRRPRPPSLGVAALTSHTLPCISTFPTRLMAVLGSAPSLPIMSILWHTLCNG